MVPLPACQFQIHPPKLKLYPLVRFLKYVTTEHAAILKATFVPYSSHLVLFTVLECVFTQTAFYEVHKDVFTHQVTSRSKGQLPQVHMKGT